MRQIPLSQNMIVVLDDDDHTRLSVYHWCYRAERGGAQGYAIRHAKIDGKTTTRYMHCEIMDPPPGHEIIFLNYERLDCRRENLRVVTKVDARRHHRVRCDSKSGVKGVRYNPDGRTWSANTYRHGHCYNIGTYYSQEDAVRAYEAELRKKLPVRRSASPSARECSAAAMDFAGGN